MSALGEWAPYAMLILVGFLPNELWRMLGIVLARGLDEDSQVIVLARATATALGYHLAQALPGLLVAGLLFLSPMSFLMSAVRNARVTADWVALVAGLVLAPLLAWRGVGLDLMWTGIVGGIVAYAAQRLREALR